MLQLVQNLHIMVTTGAEAKSVYNTIGVRLKDSIC